MAQSAYMWTHHTRRCMRRVVGVGMGLPRHDGEVEGVVVEDDGPLGDGNAARRRVCGA